MLFIQLQAIGFIQPHPPFAPECWHQQISSTNLSLSSLQQPHRITSWSVCTNNGAISTVILHYSYIFSLVIIDVANINLVLVVKLRASSLLLEESGSWGHSVCMHYPIILCCYTQLCHYFHHCLHWMSPAIALLLWPLLSVIWRISPPLTSVVIKCLILHP